MGWDRMGWDGMGWLRSFGVPHSSACEPGTPPIHTLQSSMHSTPHGESIKAERGSVVQGWENKPPIQIVEVGGR